MSYSEQLLKVQLPESVVNGKILSKLERMMTTQRELVEELRLVLLDYIHDIVYFLCYRVLCET